MAWPAIVLVHGFWGGAAHWAKVIVQLSAMGCEAISAVENPLTSLADNAARTRKMIAQQGVRCCWSAIPMAALSSPRHGANVVRLVHIAAFAPAVDEALGDVGNGFPAPPGIGNLAPDSDGYVWIKPDKIRESFCQNLTADEAVVMVVTQKAPPGSLFGERLTKAAWQTKPSWYQVSSEDHMIDPANEERMAKRMRTKKIITLPASHASLVSRPNDVCALIDEAAKATT